MVILISYLNYKQYNSAVLNIREECMMSRILSFIVFGLTVLMSFAVQAQQIPERYMVIAPACLIKETGVHFTTIYSTKQFSFLQADAVGLNKLMMAKHAQTSACGGFLNVTDEWDELHKSSGNDKQLAKEFLKKYTLPKTPIRIEAEKNTYLHDNSFNTS